MNLGEKIKKIRVEQKLTQDEFADMLYVTRSAISKWETNNGYPSIDILKQIAIKFNITIDDLLSEEDIINKQALEKSNYKLNNLISFAGLLTAIVSIIILFFIKTSLIIGIVAGVSILSSCLYLVFTNLALMYYKDKKISKKTQYLNKFREISSAVLLFIILYILLGKF